MSARKKNSGLETEIQVPVLVLVCHSLCDLAQTLPSLRLSFSSCYMVDFFEALTYT